MAAAAVKGDHYGLRDTVGNLSTPWLLVAYLAGLTTRRPGRGALLGLGATGAALAGFYLVVAITTDDHSPTLGEHLGQVLHKNRLWLYAGLLSGPTMGAFGAMTRRFAPDVRRAALRVTALLLMLEPLVIVAARIVPGWREVIHWTLDPGPYLVEAALGIAVALRIAVALTSRHEKSGNIGHGPNMIHYADPSHPRHRHPSECEPADRERSAEALPGSGPESVPDRH
ncbi:hypothetical protein ACTI_62360 [Actinoplanes sp. OR16]|nr:hypothetical protein ACTI_62360 [Actinoplanes sp. OR16]